MIIAVIDAIRRTVIEFRFRAVIIVRHRLEEIAGLCLEHIGPTIGIKIGREGRLLL
jgi:hypothetical protein